MKSWILIKKSPYEIRCERLWVIMCDVVSQVWCLCDQAYLCVGSYGSCWRVLVIVGFVGVTARVW